MSDDKPHVPAGGAGADTGTVDSASIDPADRADIQNISSQNDIPGVGTRAADGSMETDLDDADPERQPRDDDTDDGTARGVSADGRMADAATSDDLSVDAYEPGVDPGSADSSRLVGDDE